MDLGQVLLDSGAMLKGHFLLTSGRHSDTYIEKFRVLEQPKVLTALCQAIADHFSGKGITHVAGPTTGGIIIAFEVARLMGLDAIYVETENGKKVLRRGKTLEPGTKVLVVDDVLTTGTSIFEVIETLRGQGATIEGVGVLISRAPKPIDFGAPLFASFHVEAVSYAPNEVPESLAQIPITKPGTRVTATP
ncbi:MAG: orotate phosphoribosyltransferase [Armatimonadetes bacterium]|nr:orotate phosphoribosyltransferase [Armatimonadota bacterium]